MTEAMASKNGTGHVKTNSKTNYSAYTRHPEVGNSTSTRSSHCVPLPVQLSGCLPGLGVGSWLHHETGSGTQCAAGPLCPSRRFRISVINKTRTCVPHQEHCVPVPCLGFPVAYTKQLINNVHYHQAHCVPVPGFGPGLHK